MGLGHLKLDSSQIIGRSFSYDTVRGVSGGSSEWLCSPCLQPDDLCWFRGLKLLSASVLVDCPVTRICWVAARTSYSSIEYLFARQNRSSMVVGGFLASDLKNGVPGHIFRLKICRTASMP